VNKRFKVWRALKSHWRGSIGVHTYTFHAIARIINVGLFPGMTEGAGVTTPISEEGFLHKRANFSTYRRLFLTALEGIEPPALPEGTTKVFIPRPQSLLSFWENTADDLVLSAAISLNDVLAIQKRFTGYLFHFHNAETATKFRTSFPRDMKVGVKFHHFVVDEAPPEFTGVKVRVAGLPPGTTKTKLREIAELLSLRSDDVKFADILRSRGGIPTDKGIMIFRIAPVMLLNNTTLT